jgi:hypothetical protein
MYLEKCELCHELPYVCIDTNRNLQMGDLRTQQTEQLRKPRPELTMPRQIEGNTGSVLLATKFVVGSLWRNSGAEFMELSLQSAELISTKALFNGSIFANKVAWKHRYFHPNVIEFWAAWKRNVTDMEWM